MNNKKGNWLILGTAGFIFLIFMLANCAGLAPVPGGTDTENETFYKSKEELLLLLDTLAPGMAESAVFERLGRKPPDFTLLRRDEVVTALLGTSNIEVRDDAHKEEFNKTLLQTLYGYKMNYSNITRKHGFITPIRIRTDEAGYSYSVILIFKEGRLFEKPIVAGGVVNRNSSKTIFDYINPGTFMSRTP